MMKFEEIDGAMHCIFPGNLDTLACGEVENEVYEQVRQTALPIVFDLKPVEFVASSFFTICLRVFKIVGPERLTIIHLQPLVKKLFSAVGLDQKIHIE